MNFIRIRAYSPGRGWRVIEGELATNGIDWDDLLFGLEGEPPSGYYGTVLTEDEFLGQKRITESTFFLGATLEHVKLWRQYGEIPTYEANPEVEAEVAKLLKKKLRERFGDDVQFPVDPP